MYKFPFLNDNRHCKDLQVLHAVYIYGGEASTVLSSFEYSDGRKIDWHLQVKACLGKVDTRQHGTRENGVVEFLCPRFLFWQLSTV